MDGDDARRNAASASQESSLCRTYGFDPSGNLSGGQVRIGKGAAETKEAEEAEEAKPKVDRETCDPVAAWAARAASRLAGNRTGGGVLFWESSPIRQPSRVPRINFPVEVPPRSCVRYETILFDVEHN